MKSGMRQGGEERATLSSDDIQAFKGVLFDLLQLTQQQEFNAEEREIGRVGMLHLDALDLVEEASRFFQPSPVAFGMSRPDPRTGDYVLARLAVLAMLSPNTSVQIGPIRVSRFVQPKGPPAFGIMPIEENFVLGPSGILADTVKKSGDDLATEMVRANTMFHLLKEERFDQDFVTSLVSAEEFQSETSRVRKEETLFTCRVKMALSEETRKKLHDLIPQSRISQSGANLAKALIGEGVTIFSALQ